MFRSAIFFFFIHFDSLRALSRKCYLNIWIIWDGFENCRSISSNFMDIVGALYCWWPVSLEWIPTESGGYFSYAESPEVRTAREQKYSKIWKSIPKKALLNGFGVIFLINWHAILMNVVTYKAGYHYFGFIRWLLTLLIIKQKPRSMTCQTKWFGLWGSSKILWKKCIGWKKSKKIRFLDFYSKFNSNMRHPMILESMTKLLMKWMKRSMQMLKQHSKLNLIMWRWIIFMQF